MYFIDLLPFAIGSAILFLDGMKLHTWRLMPMAR
jgi:hypothetical protein